MWRRLLGALFRRKEMELGKSTGKITKDIGIPYPDVFWGTKVTSRVTVVRRARDDKDKRRAPDKKK
jgi:hypothetical protein